MLYQDQRIRAGGANGLNDLHTELHVFVRHGFRLIGVEVVVPVIPKLGVQNVRHYVAQVAVELQLTQLM